jgi:hypothetical protein
MMARTLRTRGYLVLGILILGIFLAIDASIPLVKLAIPSSRSIDESPYAVAFSKPISSQSVIDRDIGFSLKLLRYEYVNLDKEHVYYNSSFDSGDLANLVFEAQNTNEYPLHCLFSVRLNNNGTFQNYTKNMTVVASEKIESYIQIVLPSGNTSVNMIYNCSRRNSKDY